MIESEIILFLFEGLAVLAVLAILFSKNVLYAVLLLLVFLLCVAGIFVMLQAEVLAATQILIYAGGVLVLMLFGIMLTEKINQKPLQVGLGNLFGGLFAGALVLIVLVYSLQGNYAKEPEPLPSNNVQAIGTHLMGDFVLPFEIAGVLLLVSLIGAAVGATSSKSGS